MYVQGVLVHPAELEQVISVNQAHVVANGVIVAVPITFARILGVHVVRDERIGGFAADLQRGREIGELGRSKSGVPQPKIPSVAVVEVVRQKGGKIGGESGHIKRGNHWPEDLGFVLA